MQQHVQILNYEALGLRSEQTTKTEYSVRRAVNVEAPVVTVYAKCT